MRPLSRSKTDMPTKAPDGSGKPSEWKLLKMTRATFESKKIDLKFEWPSPVGDIEEMNEEQSGGERFPHIFGGIPTEGVVIQEFDITRAEDGEEKVYHVIVNPSFPSYGPQHTRAHATWRRMVRITCRGHVVAAVA